MESLVCGGNTVLSLMYPISGQVSSCIQVCLAAGLVLLRQLKVLGVLFAQCETVKSVCCLEVCPVLSDFYWLENPWKYWT